jgi:pilus assembly protein CpaC
VQDIAGPFAGGVENVINLVTIDGEDQVYVQVTVAEVRREVARQLGAVAQYAFDVGSAALTATSAPNNLINTSILSPTGIMARFNGGGIDFNFLEETSALKVLAQPTLTAVSGEEAKFLAGGEFPVPVSRDEDGNIIVTYKQFGVALNMVPIVHSEGRITLKIGTEVSELSGENAFTSSSGFTLPSILTRRTNTTVEMPSGGSIVLGGLIKEETRMGISGVPGAKDIPILGTLFRSNDFKSSRTELMIIVTPYIVKPVDANKLASPVDNMAPAISAENFFLGRLTQVYGVKNGRSSGNFHGNVGFVIE